MNFDFAYPYFLVLLLLIPCFIWCKEKLKTSYFPNLVWMPQPGKLSHLDIFLKIVIFSLLVFALSSPFTYDAKGYEHKKGRDLVLAIDASGSMAMSGFDAEDRFKNRFDINMQIANDFISKRFDDNMGIVLFGTFAYTASPLTYDIKSLSFMLAMTHVGIAGDSTAMGDALMQSIKTLSYGDAKNKVIVLLSDGKHNSGSYSPKQAVELALSKGIKIYTIGIGKKEDYDASLLDTIAKQSGAKSYSATDAKELVKIYKDIDELEPSPIKSENYLNQELYFLYPLLFATLILMLWTISDIKRAKR
jgi:Ca-activated chloride channel family protein